MRITPRNPLHYSLAWCHEMVAGREVLRGEDEATNKKVRIRIAEEVGWDPLLHELLEAIYTPIREK
jgi:hypothetical protein